MDDSLRKLKGDELREFVDKPSGSISVLIEPELPRTTVTATRPDVGQRREWRFEQTPQSPDADARLEEVSTWLTGVLQVKPTWLGAAKLFTASVTSDQLRTMLDSPLIRAIHSNNVRR